MKRILIVDDHAIVRKGIKETLEDVLGPTSFGEASNATDAIKMITSGFWDLVLLDIGLGEHQRNGLDVLKEMRTSHPCLPILVLSQYPEAEFGLRAIRLGANGYISKGTGSEELVAAIQRVVAGGKYITSIVAECMAAEFQQPTVPVHERLSPRELDLLIRIAQGKKLKQVAEEWKLSIKTVGTYHLRMLAKMGMKTDVQLTRYAIFNKLVA